jgi:hypothetical protein
MNLLWMENSKPEETEDGCQGLPGEGKGHPNLRYQTKSILVNMSPTSELFLLHYTACRLGGIPS